MFLRPLSLIIILSSDVVMVLVQPKMFSYSVYLVLDELLISLSILHCDQIGKMAL